MSITNEMIEEALETWWKTEPFGFDHPDTKTGILALMKGVRDKMLEQASAGFEEWFQGHYPGYSLESFSAHQTRQTWTAARLGADREIEELKGSVRREVEAYSELEHKFLGLEVKHEALEQKLVEQTKILERIGAGGNFDVWTDPDAKEWFSRIKFINVQLQARITDLEQKLAKATRFEFGDVVAEARGYDKWAVIYHGGVYDRRAEKFVYEPMPSSRTEEFLAATRFTRDEAIELAMRFHELRMKPQNK